MIAIKNIELIGNSDEFYPLGGIEDVCVVLNRTGNTAIEVPNRMCLRGTNAGILGLTGNGNVTLCGQLFASKSKNGALEEIFDVSELFRPIDFLHEWINHANVFFKERAGQKFAYDRCSECADLKIRIEPIN